MNGVLSLGLASGNHQAVILNPSDQIEAIDASKWERPLSERPRDFQAVLEDAENGRLTEEAVDQMVRFSEAETGEYLASDIYNLAQLMREIHQSPELQQQLIEINPELAQSLGFTPSAEAAGTATRAAGEGAETASGSAEAGGTETALSTVVEDGVEGAGLLSRMAEGAVEGAEAGAVLGAETGPADVVFTGLGAIAGALAGSFM
ncbi:MAG: hypothetical protein RIR70_929 [Pseudomonadota bacterium]|jgi:hypothetical protein